MIVNQFEIHFKKYSASPWAMWGTYGDVGMRDRAFRRLVPYYPKLSFRKVDL